MPLKKYDQQIAHFCPTALLLYSTRGAHTTAPNTQKTTFSDILLPYMYQLQICPLKAICVLHMHIRLHTYMGEIYPYICYILSHSQLQ